MFKKDNTPTRKTLDLLKKVEADHKPVANGAVRIHLKRYTGQGRFSKITTADHDHMSQLLRFFDIEFAYGNDAPRGGKLGDYIQFAFSDLEKLINSVKELQHGI